ncbi:oxygen-insensitive NAD(P)H nitroreductase [Azohydromonas caseinilytica]|uniref:Oxygen-insensitive NAD(P)H nitroreductase n=1 Tax=Azohydromonas caseinilytica TaxID=2728836 RepID=A0A848FEE0_9BURK|nr:oxygen-insensitive NAD(P)H nitroreductase [Azohydromonas caseinilytica]NML17185.1 oxygen-insensitive NAD(P)H nitroreductase [Azohydromonas caseinilytica]
MNVLATARHRYTTKAFDAQRRIPQATIDELKELLRHAPSSVNSQPWHFLVAGDAESRQRIAKAAQGGYAYNASKILDASHVIVLASRLDLDDAHLERLLDQEERDGRFQAEGARDNQRKGRAGYVSLHRHERKDLQHWMDKQVYLALGSLLLGAGALGVDATPMEGFDATVLDEELGLRERGLTSVVLVALGYRGEGDFNARLPKSRLPAAEVFTQI